MIKAILFDIDGTLSLMDPEEFMRNYVGLLAPRFAHLLPPDKFAKQVFRSTEVIIKNPQPDRTNLQTFFDDFTKSTGLSFSSLWPIFESFYSTDFPALRCLVKGNLLGKEVVDTAIRQGYTVAIAANPVMPLEAIKERIRWADLNPDRFCLIPCIEEFHYCKPQLGFFKELAQKLDLAPEECVMVGNHPVEDMNAALIGMRTFLVSNSKSDLKVDYCGGLDFLMDLILKGTL